MKLNRSLFLFTTPICALLLLALSCQNSGERNAQGYHFSLTLKPGERYFYTIHNESSISAEAEEKTVESLNKVDIGFFYEVISDSASVFNVRITYDQLRAEIQATNAGQQVIDINDSSSFFDPVAKAFSRLKGGTMDVSINSKGQVLSVKGADVLYNNVTSALVGGNSSENASIRQQLSQLAGEEFIQNNIGQLFSLYPDSVIHQGDKWTRKSVQNNGIAVEAVTMYTLEGIKDSTIEVKEASEIEHSGTTTVNLFGYQVQASFSGTLKGDLETNRQTGMIQKAESTTRLKGEIQLMGRQIPVKVKLSREIKLRRLR